jgi:hypothetical protein
MHEAGPGAEKGGGRIFGSKVGRNPLRKAGFAERTKAWISFHFPWISFPFSLDFLPFLLGKASSRLGKASPIKIHATYAVLYPISPSPKARESPLDA